MDHPKFSISSQPGAETMVFEYSIRLDKECEPLVWNQISMARKLYNNLIAAMRATYNEMNEFVLERAGEEAAKLNTEISELIEQFKIAKKEQNEEGIKLAVLILREKRAELSAQLKVVRAQYKDEIKSLFYDQIGLRSTCATYLIRSQAVKEGLGWATANDVLTRAIKAFQARIKIGQPPKFAVGSEKQQDTLRIQFTQAGGCPVATLFESENSGFALRAENGFGRRKFGTFQFRLGEAKADIWARGSFFSHREIPAGSKVASAVLVQRRIGKDLKHSLQLVVKLPQESVAQPERPKKFCALHFGWSVEEDRQYVMALADQAKPKTARLFQLPESIGIDFSKVEEKSSQRSQLLNDLVQLIKSGEMTMPSENEAVVEEFDAIKRLPATHISQSRLHRLCRLMMESYMLRPEELEKWRRRDRILHQSIAHIRRRAQYRRRDFYRVIAADIARNYDAIVIESPDLKKANTKIDMVSGEKSDLLKKSRSGQRTAALHQLITQLRNAAGKTGSIIVDLAGAKTVSTCASCGEEGTKAEPDNWQMLQCPHCGANNVRKKNGAAVAWQLAVPVIDDLMVQAREQALIQSGSRAASKAERTAKVAAARKANRAAREAAAAKE